MDLKQLEQAIQAGESETVEFKKSTAQLPRAGETLCGFLNGNGGMVVIGVGADGKILGQEVADSTQQDIARMLDRFEPPAPVETSILPLRSGKSVIVLRAPHIADARPFTYDGRPYQRIGTSTSRLPQDRYESLLLERAHARRRWENQPAVGVRLEDLDHEEILQTREAAIRHRRISAGTSTDPGDILDRLGLRRDGAITQAAQMLYGTRFLSDYPQGRLKLGRFRGTKITGDILDNKQEYMHAFAMVREAMAFLDRTLPLSGHFVEGRIEREDRLPVPPDALREILLNAVMHRDYSHLGGMSPLRSSTIGSKSPAWAASPPESPPKCSPARISLCCATPSSPKPSTAPGLWKPGAVAPTGSSRSVSAGASNRPRSRSERAPWWSLFVLQLDLVPMRGTKLAPSWH
jgi:ATP-dependent DNA helicase RecG